MTRGFPLYGAATQPFLLWRLNSGEPYVRKVPVRFGGRGGSRPSLPLSARSIRSREATLFRADGVVSSAPMQCFAGLTTPSAPLLEAARSRACASRKGGFAIFLLMSRPPLLCEEGNIPRSTNHLN